MADETSGPWPTPTPEDRAMLNPPDFGDRMRLHRLPPSDVYPDRAYGWLVGTQDRVWLGGRSARFVDELQAVLDARAEGSDKARRPRAEGGVWGSYVEYLKGLEAELEYLRRCLDTTGGTDGQ